MGSTTPTPRGIAARYPIATALAIGVALVVMVAPSSAQTNQVANCREMTDSIVRLHWAYYGQPPPPAVLQNWAAAYQAGQLSLVEIADGMLDADRFVNSRGRPSSSRFVDQVYLNSTGSYPDLVDHEYWTEILEAGGSRGEMALALTETSSAAAITGTIRPLSGFLRHYPAGVSWYCGRGSETVSIIPMVGSSRFDLFAGTIGDDVHPFEFTVQAGTEPVTTLKAGSAQGGYDVLYWDQALDLDPGVTVDRLVVTTENQVRWSVVFYPQSIGDARLGWQVDTDP